MTGTVTLLRLSWSISRGRDTYGYNIRRLDDTDTGKRYRCNGGGYDMTGTVLADWCTDRHAGRIMAAVESGELMPYTAYNGVNLRDLSQPAPCTFGADGLPYTNNPEGLYGLAVTGGGNVRIDGACGESSVIRIMQAVGFDVRAVYGGRRSRSGVLEYVVTDTRAGESRE